MATIHKQDSLSKSASSLGKQKNYNEVIDFLDTHWSHEQPTEKTFALIGKLDQALKNPSKKLKAILVGGTNGKGLTIHFATKLFQEEKISVGAFYSPHILSYNERFILNNEAISNKVFTELANEVINTAETHAIPATSFDILTMMGILYFSQNNVDVALLEMKNNSPYDPTNICQPSIFAITRITNENSTPKDEKTADYIKYILLGVKPGTHVISGDQSKLNLQLMADQVALHKGIWEMPIRKLAALAYPFEQLHGRCAALAERICQIYVDDFLKSNTVIINNSLLSKPKGQRGRPTLQRKKESLENPQKTLEQFWKEESSNLPGRFQVLDKEKPTILLDNASNVDALKNLLLGIRLMHYQRPLKGLAFIFACDKNQINVEEFLRLLRYFSKKNSGQIIFCPLENHLPSVKEESWAVDQITNDVKSLKIKAKSSKNFEEAFEMAKKSVDERHGLIVISGSQSIVSLYWKHKGIKKIDPAR